MKLQLNPCFQQITRKFCYRKRPAYQRPESSCTALRHR